VLSFEHEMQVYVYHSHLMCIAYHLSEAYYSDCLEAKKFSCCIASVSNIKVPKLLMIMVVNSVSGAAHIKPVISLFTLVSMCRPVLWTYSQWDVLSTMSYLEENIHLVLLF